MIKTLALTAAVSLTAMAPAAADQPRVIDLDEYELAVHNLPGRVTIIDAEHRETGKILRLTLRGDKVVVEMPDGTVVRRVRFAEDR
ncbi:MAG: hypothetical protein ACFB22_08820 [Rhodothalassiaceae bacterium]